MSMVLLRFSWFITFLLGNNLAVGRICSLYNIDKKISMLIAVRKTFNVAAHLDRRPAKGYYESINMNGVMA